MTAINFDDMPVIRANALTTNSMIDHAFFTRQGGVSTGIYSSLNCGFGSGDKEENVSENRLRVSEKLGVVPPSLVSVYQVHGTNVVTVERPTEW